MSHDYNDEDIFDLLTDQLGREPSEEEIVKHIERLEARWFDNIESELGGN
jgi:hypothetical protein